MENNRVHNIMEYGAVPDGVTNNASAIQKAIDAASKEGGTVLVPAGEFLSGTLQLKSNLTLYLAKGAVLTGSLKQEEILEFAALFEDENEDTGWDGGCFLFACHEENITICGEGTIYGQGDKVFFDDDTDNGYHESPKNVTAFRPRTTFLEDVTKLVIRDITIKDAAFWTLHMAGCRDVRIEDITIQNDERGANNDGIDPDCCQDVLIKGCNIKTGDDAIVIKTTKPMAEKYGSCENIIISGCLLSSHDSALKIGTETHGDIRNILLSDCIVKDCSRGIGIWARDGGVIEDVHIHHVSGSVRKYADAYREDGPSMWWGNGEPIFINATYRDEKKRYPGKIRNITFDHIYMKAESSLFIAGEANARVEQVTVSDCRIKMCKQGTQESGYFDEQPSIRNVYPHTIPAVYLRGTDSITIRAVVEMELPYCERENKLYEIEDCLREDIQMTKAYTAGSEC